MIHVYCEDGKGKTTAAIGLSLRMVGSGKKVLVAQFFKNGNSSEIKALSTFSNVTIMSQKENFGRFSKMSEEDKVRAKEYYPKYIEEVENASDEVDLLVLDELTSVINHGLIDLENVLEFLKDKRDELEIVITGRNPDGKLLEIADYVTEMKKVKHPYDKGVKARRGIEF